MTGLDANNKAITLFDNRLPLATGPYGIASVNLWITDSYPPGLSSRDDPATKPIGISPPDNGDVVVQQATNHGWINHGTQPCRILFVLMDSRQP